MTFNETITKFTEIQNITLIQNLRDFFRFKIINFDFIYVDMYVFLYFVVGFISRLILNNPVYFFLAVLGFKAIKWMFFIQFGIAEPESIINLFMDIGSAMLGWLVMDLIL